MRLNLHTIQTTQNKSAQQAGGSLTKCVSHFSAEKRRVLLYSYSLFHQSFLCLSICHPGRMASHNYSVVTHSPWDPGESSPCFGQKIEEQSPELHSRGMESGLICKYSRHSILIFYIPKYILFNPRSGKYFPMIKLDQCQ